MRPYKHRVVTWKCMSCEKWTKLRCGMSDDEENFINEIKRFITHNCLRFFVVSVSVFVVIRAEETVGCQRQIPFISKKQIVTFAN